MRQIRPFLSIKLACKIRQRIKNGDLRLLKIYSDFNDGLISVPEFWAEIYRTFSGLDEFLDSLVPVGFEECFESANKLLGKEGLELARQILSAKKPHKFTKSLFTDNKIDVDQLTHFKNLILNK